MVHEIGIYLIADAFSGDRPSDQHPHLFINYRVRHPPEYGVLFFSDLLAGTLAE